MIKFEKKYWLYPLVLLIICGIVTTALYFLNRATVPIIAEQLEKATNAAKSEVIEGIEYADQKTQDNASVYYDKKKKIVAIVLSETTKGYSGEISAIVGVAFFDGKAMVSGVKVISQSETAGLGANVENESFLKQYSNKITNIGVAKSAPEDNEIQALTGATITSRAITLAVNTAIKEAEEIYAKD